MLKGFIAASEVFKRAAILFRPRRLEQNSLRGKFVADPISLGIILSGFGVWRASISSLICAVSSAVSSYSLAENQSSGSACKMPRSCPETINSLLMRLLSAISFAELALRARSNKVASAFGVLRSSLRAARKFAFGFVPMITSVSSSFRSAP